MEMVKALEDKLTEDLYGLNLPEKTMEEKAKYAQILVTLKQLHEKTWAETMAESMRSIGNGYAATQNTEAENDG